MAKRKQQSSTSAGAGKPALRAFISSTATDLTDCREAASRAAVDAGFYPERFENWPARDNTPLNECLAQVDDSHVVVALVAHRYGWEPPEQDISCWRGGS